MVWLKNWIVKRRAEAEAEKTETDAWIERDLEEQKRILALSFEEARQQAELLLADPLKFTCVASPPSNDALTILAPGLLSLFSRLESVHAVDSEAFLSRQDMAPLIWEGNDLLRGHIVSMIGQAHRHAVALVKPHEERVYDLSEGDLELYPSVYHWLLMTFIRDSKLSS